MENIEELEDRNRQEETVKRLSVILSTVMKSRREDSSGGHELRARRRQVDIMREFVPGAERKSASIKLVF